MAHNAEAALSTRDSQGRFGGWWCVAYCSGACNCDSIGAVLLPSGAIDYRNGHGLLNRSGTGGTRLVRSPAAQSHKLADGDRNDRGRGLSVETQGSGLAVVRATYELMRLLKLDI